MQLNNMSDKIVKRRSPVWRYFNQIDENRVECVLCSIRLSYRNKSTGTMTNHLKIKHKMNPGDGKLIDEPSQSKITSNFTAPVSKMSQEQHMVCHRKLVAWCAEDLRPLNIVDGQGFHKFMFAVAPGYTVPSSSTVRKYLDMDYTDKCAVLTNLMACTPVALTTDMWTSADHQGYITCTAHFLGDNWTPYNFVLATRMMEDRHTGVNMSEELKSIIYQFNIAENDIVGILDNASNMYTCAQTLKWEHYPCFAHTLQLSVRAGLDQVPAIKKAIAACKRVVKYFNNSVLATTELGVRQEQNNIPKHSLIMDVDSRWNSTYLMMDRLLEQRLAIYAVLMDQNIIKKSDAATLDMSDTCWSIMESLMPVLKPFYVATSVMSSEEYPTLSVILPILTSLLTRHLQDSEADSAAVAKFKNIVKMELNKHYDMKSPNETMLLASFVDPRHKRLLFLSEEQRQGVHAAALENLNSSFIVPDVVSEQTSNENAVYTENATTSCGQCNDPGALSFLLGAYYEDEDCSSVTPGTPQEELDMYMELKPVAGGVNPFKWWAVNCSRFPTLAAIARKILCIPGTEVPLERVFSAAGGTVSKRRTLLAPDCVDKLVFLHKFGMQENKLAGKQVATAIKQEPASDNSGDTAPNDTQPILPQLPSIRMETDQ